MNKKKILMRNCRIGGKNRFFFSEKTTIETQTALKKPDSFTPIFFEKLLQISSNANLMRFRLFHKLVFFLPNFLKNQVLKTKITH